MEIRHLGIVPYADAWKLQLDLIEARAEERIPDTLLVVEHPHVITLGRKSPETRALEQIPNRVGEVPVHVVERGGEATYHGPGQLVMYPIFRLSARLGPKGFLHVMERAMIRLLAEYGIESYAIEGKTGVWLRDRRGEERKIASLGIAVRRGVSYHGLALNVRTDLSYFRLIQPCGFAPSVMTNLTELLDEKAPPLMEVADALARRLREEYLGQHR